MQKVNRPPPVASSLETPEFLAARRTHVCAAHTWNSIIVQKHSNNCGTGLVLGIRPATCLRRSWKAQAKGTPFLGLHEIEEDGAATGW